MYPKNNLNSKKPQGTNFSEVPDDSQLAARWIADHPQTIYYQKKYYRPANDGYIEISKDIIRQEIYNVLLLAVSEGCRVNNRCLNSMMELARIEIAVTSENYFKTGGEK